VRWVHNARGARVLLPVEKKDIVPSDYKKKGLPYVFDLEHSRCRTTVTNSSAEHDRDASLRLSPQDAEDVASYLLTLKKQEPSHTLMRRS